MELNQVASADDKMEFFNLVRAQEKASWNPEWEIKRFESKKDHRAFLKAERDGEVLDLYSEIEALDLFGAPQHSVIPGNMMMNIGINNLWKIACSGTGTKLDATNAYLGVGDSSTAEAATQTELQAATNRFYQVMDGSFPTYGTSQLSTYQITVASANANFAWNEMGLTAGETVGSPPTANNLTCRKVSAQGTKLSGQTWVLTYTVTIA